MEEFPVKTMDYSVPLGWRKVRQIPWIYGSHFTRPLPTSTHTVVMDAGFVLSPDMRIKLSTANNATVVASGRSHGNTKR